MKSSREAGSETGRRRGTSSLDWDTRTRRKTILGRPGADNRDGAEDFTGKIGTNESLQDGPRKMSEKALSMSMAVTVGLLNDNDVG